MRGRVATTEEPFHSQETNQCEGNEDSGFLDKLIYAVQGLIGLLEDTAALAVHYSCQLFKRLSRL